MHSPPGLAPPPIGESDQERADLAIPYVSSFLNAILLDNQLRSHIDLRFLERNRPNNEQLKRNEIAAAIRYEVDRIEESLQRLRYILGEEYFVVIKNLFVEIQRILETQLSTMGMLT